MAAKSIADLGAKPRNDAYTGMLTISLVAMLAGCMLLWHEMRSYPTTKPTEVSPIPRPQPVAAPPGTPPGSSQRPPPGANPMQTPPMAPMPPMGTQPGTGQPTPPANPAQPNP